MSEGGSEVANSSLESESRVSCHLPIWASLVPPCSPFLLPLTTRCHVDALLPKVRHARKTPPPSLPSLPDRSGDGGGAISQFEANLARVNLAKSDLFLLGLNSNFRVWDVKVRKNNSALLGMEEVT